MIGTGFNTEFLVDMLQPIHEARMWEPVDGTPADVTDLRLYRVIWRDWYRRVEQSRE